MIFHSCGSCCAAVRWKWTICKTLEPLFFRGICIIATIQCWSINFHRFSSRATAEETVSRREIFGDVLCARCYSQNCN